MSASSEKEWGIKNNLRYDALIGFVRVVLGQRIIYYNLSQEEEITLEVFFICAV